MTPPVDAVVVGAGPNGLAAAITLARAGVSVRVYEGGPTIGGGSRTAELTLPGFRHDVCAAVHPFGAGSPIFRSLPLHRHGLEWMHPDIPLAHPFDDGSAVTLCRSLDDTVASLPPPDRTPFRSLVEPLTERWDDLAEIAFGPVVRRPRHPFLMARFGLPGLRSVESLASRFEHSSTRGFVAGLANHVPSPIDRPLTAAAVLLFAASAGAVGWPVARGGSQAIVDALARHLRELGGEIVTDAPVRSLDELPPHRVVLLDVMPRALATIAGSHLPDRFRRRLTRYRHGPGVFKIDYALDGPVPWTADACRRAGTVHLGPSLEDIRESEALVASGEHPIRPFLIVAQPDVADPDRAPDGRQTLWAYAHVPNGSSEDATRSIERQIERFAPGFTDHILARSTRRPAEMEDDNPNLVGGDIAGGAVDGLQFLVRPVPRLDPYTTPNPSIFLCSSATPPGPGVHGMCGYHAARSALRRVFDERDV